MGFKREFNIHNLVFFLILLSPILISGYKMRRFYNTLSFLFVYTFLSGIFTFGFSLQSLINRISDPTTIFFAIVMLPEPMTSPVNRNRQILFGLTVAFIVTIISHPKLGNALFAAGSLPDVFLSALLVANLLFFKYR